MLIHRVRLVRLGLLLFYLLYHCAAGCAQNDPFIREMMDEFREKGHSGKNTSYLLKRDPAPVFQELLSYSRDPSEDVRYAVMVYTHQIYKKNANHAVISSEMATQLLAFCYDTSYYMRQQARELLNTLKARDFSEENKKTIKQLLTNGNECYVEVLGVAQMTDQIDILKAYLHEKKENKISYSNWEVRLTLARLGDTASINYCIKQLERVPDLNERVIFGTTTLAYIRQPQSIELLVQYLFLDGHVGGPDDDDIDDTPYANYVLRELTPIIEGFPVAQGISVIYTEKEVEIARAWIRSHPDYKIIR
jgi:prepilin-type processing-associated H-X9-DG protein